jgi:hypothetical protein
LGDKNNQEIHVRTIRGNTTITDLANVPANNLRSSSTASGVLTDRRRVEIRHQDNRLSVLLNDVLLVNNVNTGLSNLFVNGAGSGAVVGFSAGTNLAGDGHDIFNFTMTNVQTPRGDDDDDNPVCTIPLSFLGPILCFVIRLLLALF